MLQALLFPKWDVPDLDVTQMLTAWEKQNAAPRKAEHDENDIVRTMLFVRGCRRKKGHFAKDCWNQTNKRVGKEIRARKTRKVKTEPFFTLIAMCSDFFKSQTR